MLRFSDHKGHTATLVQAALNAADPAAALARHWSLPEDGQVVLLAIGKASRALALEALDRVGDRVVAAVVTTPPEHADPSPFSRWPVEVLPCDHPLPSPRNVQAAVRVRALVEAVTPQQRLVVLISGGGSAHLALPANGLSLDDIGAATKALQRCGATINELNTVRKHCEQLKGGRLAALSRAQHLHAFVLSDVMGDPLDVIASGPTAPDPSTYADALAMLEARSLLSTSSAVTSHLHYGAAGQLPETPKPGDPAFNRVSSTIIANNRTVLAGVEAAARMLGFALMGVDQVVEGAAAVVGRRLASKAAQLTAAAPACYILGGETTVDVGTTRGRGGPSQEMALAFAAGLGSPAIKSAALLTFSTDGRDGPTDAAGGVVSSETPGIARLAGVDLSKALAAHDSYRALDRLGMLVRVPPTGTNLNHVAALLVYPS